MAGWTGHDPAASCVTGMRSNQLSYHPIVNCFMIITFRPFFLIYRNCKRDNDHAELKK